MTKEERSAQSSDAWERWIWVWFVLGYFALVASGYIAFGDQDSFNPSLTAAFIAYAIWYSILLIRRRLFWTGHLPYSSAYFLVGAALWGVLVSVDPVFLMLASAIYPVTFLYLPIRWAVAIAVVLTLIMVFESALRTGAVDSPSTLLFFVILVPALLIAFFIDAIIRQSTRRRELIDELQATRQDLAAAERESGMMAERQRLAEEIHDTLAQGFISIVMHLEAAEGAIESDLVSTRKHIDQARSAARENLAEARKLVWALRPDLLDRLTLEEGIRRSARRWSANTGLGASVNVVGEPNPIPSDVEVILLRATQEALNNALKHAKASSASVTLTYSPNAVLLTVRDDGRGFNPHDAMKPASTTGGFGLKSLEENVEQLGGSFSIDSEPGNGTTVAISIPFDSQGARSS